MSSEFSAGFQIGGRREEIAITARICTRNFSPYRH